jgi:GNAT superfamily N-acetyltransferase
MTFMRIPLLTPEIRSEWLGTLKRMLGAGDERETVTGTAKQRMDNRAQPLLYAEAKNQRYRVMKSLSFSPGGNDTATKNTSGSTALGTRDSESGSQQTPIAQPSVSAQESGAGPNDPLQPGEAISALIKLKENVLEGTPDFDVDTFINEGTLHRPEATRSPQERFAVRLYNTHSMIDKAIESLQSVPELYSPYACYLESKPVGVMLLEKGPPVEIGFMVTHPESSGVGTALVEHAVNLSQAWGESGRIELTANNPDACNAYKALGFIGEDDVMKLDPSTSAEWVKKDGQWRRHKNH